MDVTSVDEVLMCADPALWRRGDSWLAGGTVIYSYGTDITRGAPTRLLDITGAGWTPLVWHPDGDLEIAATCRIADLRALADDPLPGGTARAELPGLDLIEPACDSFVASWKIWHVSTVGGNVATALPAGPMISLLTAWDATALILRPDGRRRRVAVADLVLGPAKTGLGYGELIRSFRIPAEALRQRPAFRRISLTERGRSAALLIGRRTTSHSVRFTVTASTFRPVVLEISTAHADAPAELRRPRSFTSTNGGDGNQWGPRRERVDADAWRAAIDREAAASGGWYDDIHGEPAWRRAMTHRLAEEILAELLPDDPRFALAAGRVTGDIRMERTAS